MMAMCLVFRSSKGTVKDFSFEVSSARAGKASTSATREVTINRFILQALPRSERDLAALAVALDGHLDLVAGRHLRSNLTNAVHVANRLALKLRDAVADFHAARRRRALVE